MKCSPYSWILDSCSQHTYCEVIHAFRCSQVYPWMTVCNDTLCLLRPPDILVWKSCHSLWLMGLINRNGLGSTVPGRTHIEVRVGFETRFWDHRFNFLYLRKRHLWPPGSDVTSHVRYTESTVQYTHTTIWGKKLCEVSILSYVQYLQEVVRSIHSPRFLLCPGVILPTCIVFC